MGTVREPLVLLQQSCLCNCSMRGIQGIIPVIFSRIEKMRKPSPFKRRKGKVSALADG